MQWLLNPSWVLLTASSLSQGHSDLSVKAYSLQPQKSFPPVLHILFPFNLPLFFSHLISSCFSKNWLIFLLTALRVVGREDNFSCCSFSHLSVNVIETNWIKVQKQHVCGHFRGGQYLPPYPASFHTPCSCFHTYADWQTVQRKQHFPDNAEMC